MSDKVLMKGCEAFAEAAIRGGIRFYFGYPITPQNELTEYMARDLDSYGGAFLQAESELAVVNMAYGAAASGGNVLISSSSPGIALMQEGFSFLASAHCPAVIVNVSRGGPGIGDIRPSQADYFQATRGGGNGDYHVMTFAPASLQEAVDLIYEAVDLADEYQNPVAILVDGMMGQMMEPVIMPEPKPATLGYEAIKAKKPWALTGKEGREKNRVLSLRWTPQELEANNLEMKKQYDKALENLVRYEATDIDGAEVVFVSFGTTSRITTEAIERLADEGIKAGLIRPISLWPFPYEAFDKITASTKAVITTELNLGQMVQDVKMGVNGRFPTHLIQRTGGMVMTSIDIVNETKRILEGVK